MELYDKEDKKYTFNLNNLLGEGKTGYVYKISDSECLKISKGYQDYLFDSRVFDILKESYLSSVVKLGVPFYLLNEIAAYTMEYCEASKESILDMPFEYTLDNLDSLYRDIQILTKYNIITNDLYADNVVIGDNQIKIVDCDNYEFNRNNLYLLAKNVDNLLYTFYGIYKKALIKKGIDLEENMIGNMTVDNYLYEYLFYNHDENISPAFILKRKIGNIKRPIELFQKKIS